MVISILQEGHRDRADAFFVDEVIHDVVEHGAFEVVGAVVHQQERHRFVDGWVVEVQFAFAAFVNQRCIHKVTGDPADGDLFAFGGVDGGACGGHVKEVVVLPDAVVDRFFIQWIFDAFFCARVVKGVFEVGISMQVE